MYGRHGEKAFALLGIGAARGTPGVREVPLGVPGGPVLRNSISNILEFPDFVRFANRDSRNLVALDFYPSYFSYAYNQRPCHLGGPLLTIRPLLLLLLLTRRSLAW